MLYLMVGAKTSPEDLKKVVAPIVRANGTPHRLLRCTDPRPHLQRGDVLMAMGNASLEGLAFHGIVPKNRTVGSLREKAHPLNEGSLMLSYDAGIGRIDPKLEVMLSTDTMLACRLHDTGVLKPKTGYYRWVDDFSDTVKHVDNVYSETGKAVKLALDLETVGLDPIDPTRFIVSISLTHSNGQADLVRFAGTHDQPKPDSKLYNQIKYLLSTHRVSMGGANLKFDCNWIFSKWGLTVDNFKFDTTLVGSLLDENRSNSLNTHAKLYTQMGGYDDEFNAKYDKGRMDLIPDDDLLVYAGGDTDATHQVRTAFTRELTQDPQLCRFYINLLHPASRAFEKMEQNGIHVNRKKLLKLGDELADEMAVLEKEALDLIPPYIKVKYRGDLKLKASIVADYLFSKRGLGIKPIQCSEKTGKPKTNHSHLQHFMDADKYPEAAQFITAYEGYNKAQKARSTYVDGFLKHLRADGKFHPSYILFAGDWGGGGDSGTVTGRLAARDPAIQTLPKHSPIAKRLRACYEPPEGYDIVECDYSQGELRVTAVVANEPQMKDAYNRGIDLHMLTGGKVAGLSYEEMVALKETDPKTFKHHRQGGKPANFGLLYGMSAGGYQSYAKDGYGVDLTLKQAQDVRFGFFDTYSALPDWHEDCIQYARTYGGIRSPLGRIRHLPLIYSRDGFLRSQAERQSINSGIQSTLSDMLIAACARLNDKYGDNDEMIMFGTIHDAIVFYIKSDKMDYWAPIIKEEMENVQELYDTFGWEFDIPLIADVEHSSKNFATMEEFEC